MSADIREQLQVTLGDAYRLDRELGGGGMSRVFVGREHALDRDVVVKVLHPELASGVSVDRFKREIQLAAQLQHPHIVPLLSAGESGGLPYLTMPFVDGRSLRELLKETGALPVGEAVSILRDVARALDYAHSRGVIHRDIKPDNVLLSRGSASVTDFGVAKAVSAARVAPGGTLTSIGTSIGTPAYMAPEQAAGDPDTDHRADIYAWGVLAYELLAGRPPFVHATPHRLLAAHMGEVPAPILDHRPDCPPALASMVMRCLEKEPDARPQQASELLTALHDTVSGDAMAAMSATSVAPHHALWRALAVYAAAVVVAVAAAQLAIEWIGLPTWVLPGMLVVMALGLPVILFTAMVHHGARVARTGAVPTPGGTIAGGTRMTRLAVKASPHLSWRRTALGGALAVGGFAVLVTAFMTMRAFGIGPAGSLFAKGVIKARDQVVVAEFTAPPEDSALGRVVSEAVRTGLTQSRAVTVMQQSQIAAALGRMELPRESPITFDVARAMAEREGAKGVVHGSITAVRGGAYILAMQLSDATSGDELTSVRVTASEASELIPAIDEGTRSLREKLGESLKMVRGTQPLERVTTGSIEALRKYTEAIRANNIFQDYQRSIALLRETVALDSSFALAWRALAVAYSNAGVGALGEDARRRAFALRHRLPEYERAIVEGTYYSGGSTADRRLAEAAHRRAIEIDPAAAASYNNLALTFSNRRDYARAESVYRLGAGRSSTSALIYSNLVITLVNRGRLDEADSMLSEFRRRFGENNPRAFLTGWPIHYQRGLKARERGDLAAGRAAWDSLGKLCRRAAAGTDPSLRSDGHICVASMHAQYGQLREAERWLAARDEFERTREGRVVSDIGPALDSIAKVAWFLERHDEAARRLDALLARRPLGEYPDAARPHVRFAELYAMAGRAQKARAILAQYDAVLDTAQRRLQSDFFHRLQGDIAMAERDYPTAIREYQRADTAYDGAPIACGVCILPRLAQAYDLSGQPDSAIAVFERYLASDYAFRASTGTDPIFLAGTYKRLGELHDAGGRPADAIRYYTVFVDLWERADPELQPKVAEIRGRIERLRRQVAR